MVVVMVVKIVVVVVVAVQAPRGGEGRQGQRQPAYVGHSRTAEQARPSQQLGDRPRHSGFGGIPVEPGIPLRR